MATKIIIKVKKEKNAITNASQNEKEKKRNWFIYTQLNRPVKMEKMKTIPLIQPKSPTLALIIPAHRDRILNTQNGVKNWIYQSNEAFEASFDYS